MEGVIDAEAALDFAEFHIIPSQNRYEACVCSGSTVEILASGLLEQLSRHIPEVNELSLKGSTVDFKIHPPEILGDAKWFTKSTLTRFLCIVASPDLQNVTNAIANEMFQLEESRKFHLSLYVKGHQDQFGNGEADDNSGGRAQYLKPEVETVSFDASKNELLLAMELRLSALREELGSAFNQAAGATCSPDEIGDLERFSQYVGAAELRNSLRKFAELSPRNQTANFSRDDKSPSALESSNESVRKTEGNPKMSKSHSDTHVKYGVSPAKVAQFERHSSTESEESSYSSEEDQPSVERSRTLIRSASPRRSASPMRRVQIGRSGSRRAAALTIKSLSSFPARERTSHRDEFANSSEEEGSKKPESNALRISVQDAISLFESKQRDQTVDTQKQKSSLNASFSANKSVLRRWSSGVGDSSSQCLPDIVSDSSVQTAPNCSEGGEVPQSSAEVKSESDFIAEVPDASESYPSGIEADDHVIKKEEGSEKLTASAEWTRQKEAELNQMLMKMMETKPVKYRSVAPNNSNSQSVPSEQRGGFKRDEKLRRESAGKQAEKEPQLRGMQKSLDERKAKIGSANLTDAGKKRSLGKPQKSNKNFSQSANSKMENSKPAVTKTTTSKRSPLPAMLKSLPSTPSPRAAGISPAKTPGGTSSAGTTPTRRRTQPAPSVPRSNPKVERSQQSPKVQRPKILKETQNDSNKSIKGAPEKNQQPISKNGKTAKTKSQTTSGDHSSIVPAKPSFYNKVTKKSSVVPLESKPFLRKGSRIGPGVGPAAVKKKVSSQPEESLTKSRNLTQAQENNEVVTITNTTDPVSHQEEMILEAVENHAHLESETGVNSPQNCDDLESSDQVTTNGDDNVKKTEESASKTGDIEESFISPTAWVEIEEEHQDLPVQCDDTRQIASPDNITPVITSSPRVRHSLSQMLLEESSESDTIEWGNAENPPATVYQKDEPKGLKRLLKFARKSRAETNLTGLSSPSAFSEGEDEAGESKTFSRKNADTLMSKAALHTKNYGKQRTSSREGHQKNSAASELLSARSNIGKFTAQSTSHKLQEGNISTAATTTKATRSFFSLSAFRGSKTNETKIR